jgi:hypothetical protein
LTDDNLTKEQRNKAGLIYNEEIKALLQAEHDAASRAQEELAAYKLKFGELNAATKPTQQTQVAVAPTPPPPAPPLPIASPYSAAASPTPPIVASSNMKEAELAFQNFMWWIGTAFEVVFALIALIVIFVLYLNFSRKSKERSAWANLPAKGPMKVNIEEQYVEAGSFNSKHVPCGLKIDVRISQNDWRVIANAGLMKKVLFHGDGPSGAQYDPENTRPWLVEDLKTPTYASFWDVQRMHDAKEELLKSLVNLRATIEAQKEGPQVTSFEL